MQDQVLDMLRRHMPAPLRPSGGSNVLTKCPFHKGGQETKPSFSVNLTKGVFHCFTCHEAGPLAKLLRMLKVPRSVIDAEMRTLKPHLDRQRENHRLAKKHVFETRDPFKADYVLPEELLGVYELCPNKLVNDGFNPALLQQLEVGYDRQTHRIMYPLRDMYGNLAGFSGGATTEGTWPKYKVYQGRRRRLDGRWEPGDFGDWFDERFPDYRCENHDFLWNFDSVWPRLIDDNNTALYVVEGFKACMWMIQNGFENTVALMGSYISERQQQMLHRLGCWVTICTDNDAAGRRAAFNVGDLLWRPLFGKIKVMVYPQEDNNTQPDDYEPEALRILISQAVPFTQYVHLIRQGRVTWQ